MVCIQLRHEIGSPKEYPGQVQRGIFHMWKDGISVWDKMLMHEKS